MGRIWRQLQTGLWGVRVFNIPGDTYSTRCRIQGHRFPVWNMGNGMGSARHHVVIRQYSMLFGFGVLVGPLSVTQEWSTILSGDVCARCDMRAMLPWVGSVPDYTYLLYSVPPTSRFSSDGTIALV
jgi:hypothetical protein